MNSETTSSIESRISSLERKNRQLRWLLLFLPLVALTLGAASQNDIFKAKKVVAEEFVLTDSEGKTRASLMLVENSAQLVLQDSAGKARVRLAANPEEAGPILFLYTKNEKTALAAGQSKDNGIGFIEFYDEGNVKAGFGGNALKK
jgi:hypothetical protein